MTPEWADFLELPEEDKRVLRNRSTYALLFIPIAERWVCITFGMGHVLLESAAFENNFGLRVALNEVDPAELRSIDVRSPDANTRMRRSQTSRGADQSAFGIDMHQDIMRVVAGKAKSKGLATRVAGADSLAIRRRVLLNELPTVCNQAYRISLRDTYKQDFGWIDQIAHVRAADTIRALQTRLIVILNDALAGTVDPSLHLAFPEIYDPEQPNNVRYRGFRSTGMYPDLDISEYLESLRERDVLKYRSSFLRTHRAYEVDDHNHNVGKNWRIADCIGCEMILDGRTYVLSSGEWYEIDKTLSEQVETAFNGLEQIALPDASVDETEPDYNKRVGGSEGDYICLDREMIRSSGAASRIEVCDLLGLDRHLIHVKNSSSASRLSHLFEQGMVAGRVLEVDPVGRDRTRKRIVEVERKLGKSGYRDLIPTGTDSFVAGDYTVVYAVITGAAMPRLTFFSQLALYRAEVELRALGYRCAFSWIRRPSS